MVVINLKGIPINFPFEPYDLQKDYMEKVIECLQDECVGVLESPTGTGKTVSLLCASLAWLETKKAQLQAQHKAGLFSEKQNDFLFNLNKELGERAGKMSSGREFLGLPTIIYASRTHSQLSQAMQELKRTAYKYMKANVLGSRDQLCIHPEIMAEGDRNLRIQMCQLKIASRSCQFYNKVDEKKEDPCISDLSVVDIEDITKLGTKHHFCPYYMTKELQKRADIIFTPYNYLLDPISRKALGLTLTNNIVILDEGHNVEKVCEEAASYTIKTTDITLAIDELTTFMKFISEQPLTFEDTPKDFSSEELCLLKEMLLDFEKALDSVPLNSNSEGVNFNGDYIFEMLEKAKVTKENCCGVTKTIESIIQYLAAVKEGPFTRKGKGLKVFADFLSIVFIKNSPEFVDKIKRCYKVHITEEEQKKFKQSNWLTKAASSKTTCRVLNYWCFSPGFGMDILTGENIRSLILTSGTLAPLNPLISELELKVQVRLENPHIVKENQICVKILTVGPDGETLNSSFQNRDNPRYISSLGRAIVNLSRVIPNGLLIFFPSYPVMLKCQNYWQEQGIWSSIYSQKAIFVEPKDKVSFAEAMASYYEKIRDPNLKGAIFMGVCRGKVSEGLDFADLNGRAVIITGLPYPPLKDPRVILKRQYLDSCKSLNPDYITGQEWYGLEATRAVNQAIGRVIRHRYDYGAILLLDERFNSFRVKGQMSMWLRDHIKIVNKFGGVIRDLSVFFKTAQNTIQTPQPDLGSLTESTKTEPSSGMSLSSSTEDGLVTIHKRSNSELLTNPTKRKKIILVRPNTQPFETVDENSDGIKGKSYEYVAMAKQKLGPRFPSFVTSLRSYKENESFEALIKSVEYLFEDPFKEIFLGLELYIRPCHKANFVKICKEKIKS